MTEIQRSSSNTVELVDRKPLCFFDFDRIQVAPQAMTEKADFRSLSLAEKQALLEKLINRVKSL